MYRMNFESRFNPIATTPKSSTANRSQGRGC